LQNRDPLASCNQVEAGMKIAVIGVGQSLRGDDGAGLEAVRHWQEKYPETSGRPEVHVELSELPGLELLNLLGAVEAAVLVDAIHGTSAPGRIQRLSLEELSAFSSASGSAHGWGVAETIRLDRQLNPEGQGTVIRFVGIEEEQMNLGEPLSPAVRRALPMAGEVIEAEINELL
jgi:hydrogenase maturation protease